MEQRLLHVFFEFGAPPYRVCSRPGKGDGGITKSPMPGQGTSSSSHFSGRFLHIVAKGATGIVLALGFTIIKKPIKAESDAPAMQLTNPFCLKSEVIFALVFSVILMANCFLFSLREQGGFPENLP